MLTGLFLPFFIDLHLRSCSYLLFVFYTSNYISHFSPVSFSVFAMRSYSVFKLFSTSPFLALFETCPSICFFSLSLPCSLIICFYSGTYAGRILQRRSARRGRMVLLGAARGRNGCSLCTRHSRTYGQDARQCRRRAKGASIRKPVCS